MEDNRVVKMVSDPKLSVSIAHVLSESGRSCKLPYLWNPLTAVTSDNQVLIRYTLENMEMSDVAVTQDQEWMVCVGNCPSQARSSVFSERSGMSQIIRM